AVPVEPHLGPVREPVDQPGDVGDLALGVVQPDLPGRLPEAARGAGQYGVSVPGALLGLLPHVLLAAAPTAPAPHGGAAPVARGAPALVVVQPALPARLPEPARVPGPYGAPVPGELLGRLPHGPLAAAETVPEQHGGPAPVGSGGEVRGVDPHPLAGADDPVGA